MARGRRRHDWYQTANIVAMIANAQRYGMDRFDRDGKRQPGPHPNAWDPTEIVPPDLRVAKAPKKPPVEEVVPITVLKCMLRPDDPDRIAWLAETRAGGEQPTTT